jgi:hypothetical protein
MRRLLRWRVLLSALILLVTATLLGAWQFTRSDAAARLVSQKLEERLGTTTHFERLSVGVSSTSVTGLRIYEQGAGADAEPFVAVGEVHLGLSLIDAIRGNSPSAITFRDAHVLLRFDRNGDLLTRAPQLGADGPGSLPIIRIESGTLTIRQEGRPESVFAGIDLLLEPIDSTLKVTGTVEDEAWGKWIADGSIPTGGSASPGRLSLNTAGPKVVTPELLRRVPFVNPNAWTHVGLAGTTSAQLELAFDMATAHVTYRMTMDPINTTVRVPSIGLEFTDAAGGLVAEGAVVTLSDVRGKAADGHVRLDSRMDFSGRDSVLHFVADLINMDVRQLPKLWRVPPELEGRLSGKLQFTVTLLENGGTRIEAAGKSTIADARLRGKKVPPIELDVQTAPGGVLDFKEPETSNGKHEVLKPASDTLVSKEKSGPRIKGRRTGLVSSVLRMAAKVVKPPDAPPEEKAYLHFNIAFRDVEVAELLKSAGVEIPVKVGGKVTVQIQLDIPTEAPDDIKAYRMIGSVNSPRLVVDELAIEGVSAKVDLRDGKLSVKELTGRLPALAGQGSESGSFQARGEIEVGKTYPFRATVKFDKVALEHVEQLKNLVPVSLPLAGELNAHATLEGTLNPVSLRTSGEAQVSKLRAGAIPADNLTFRWESDGQVIRFRDTSARLFGGEVSGEFEVPLREDVPGTGVLRLENLDLGELSKAVLAGANLKLEGKAAGTVKLRAPAAGEGESREAIAELDLQAPMLKLQNIPARKIKGAATYVAGVLKYSLTGEALGGQFEVAGQFPPPPKKGGPKADEKKTPTKKDSGLDLGRIKLRSMQLSRLWDVIGLKNALGPLDADVSGDFPLTTDDQGRLVGTGRLRAERIRWGSHDIATTGQTVLRLTSKSATFDEVTMIVGEGVIRAKAMIDRVDVNKSEADLTLVNVPIRRLLFLLPDLAARTELTVDGRLTTTMGRDWRGAGVLTASKGKLYGVPVSDVRVPIDWWIVPDRSRTEVKVRELTAMAAGGQLTGRADANFFSDLPPRFSGELTFRNVNMSQAFREAGQVVGNLPLSGKLEFSADQYRSSNDLTAKLDARVGESQPFGLPVFNAVLPFVGFAQSASTLTVREGELRAVLGQGVWRVQRLSLSGPSLDLYADGTVTAGGRLNLGVAAAARQAPGQLALQRLVPIAAVASPLSEPLGRAPLADAIILLSNYVVYLEVTGAIESPVVRLQTLRTLTADAIRFFVLRLALR